MQTTTYLPNPSRPSTSRARFASLALALLGLLALPSFALAAPDINTKTKNATYPLNNDNSARPGQTINYSISVGNNGAAGTTDATGVQVGDNIDANSAFVPNSAKVSPNAIAHSYLAAGNTQLTVNVANGLRNGVVDIDGVTPNNSLVVTAGTFGTGQGGSVAIAADGSFVYTPQTGDRILTDTFSYTVTDSDGLASTGLVTITLNNTIVWYVDATAPAGGDGSSAHPFQLLSNVSNGGAGGTTLAANDIIFVIERAGDYNGNLTLLNGQQLYGSGTALTVNTIPINASGGSNTTFTTTVAATNSITLGQNNTVTGITINATTGAKIVGTSFGTLTISNVTMSGAGQALFLTTGTVNGTIDSLSSSSGTNAVSLTTIAGTLTITTGVINGPTSDDFFINGGAGTVSYGGTITNTTGHAVDVVNKTGGTVTFSGAISDTGTGIFLNNNTSTTINFSGGLNLSTGANAAFVANSSGTVSATQNNTTIVNTLTTTTGTALQVTSTTIGSSGLTFRSISAGTGAGSAGGGIILDTTGSSGGLTVTGNSAGQCGGAVTMNAVGTPATITAPNTADCTGGTIQHKTGADGSTNGIGIYLNNTQNVSLTRMQLNDFDNYAILGNNVTGFTLTASNVSSSTTNGTSVSGVGEGDVYFTGLKTSATVTNCSFTNAIADAFHVFNDNGETLNRITLTGCRFATNTAAGNASGDALAFQATNGTFNATVQSSAMTSARSDLFQINLLGSVTSDLVFGGATAALGNSLTNNNANIVSGGGGTTWGGGGVGNNVTFNYNISHNTMQGSHGAVIGFKKGTGSGLYGATTGLIDSNVIGVQGTFGSGSTQGEGIAVYLDAASATGNNKVTTTITNNHVSGVVAARGAIDVYVFNKGTGAAVGQMKATVQGNVIDTMDQTNSFAGMYLQTGSATGAGGDNDTSCLTIGGAGALKNTIDAGTNASFAIATGIFIEQEGVSKVALPGYAGAAYDNTAVQNFVSPNNTTTGGGGVVNVTAIHDSSSPAGGGYSGNCATIGITIPDGSFVETQTEDGALIAQAQVNGGPGADGRPLKFAPGGVEKAKSKQSGAETATTVAIAKPTTIPVEMPVATDTTAAIPAVPVAPIPQSGLLKQAKLDSVVATAIARWEATGLNGQQLEALRSLTFEVADLPSIYLGEADGNRIRVDNNAGGNGWYVGPNGTLFGKSVSATRSYTYEGSAPAGRLDLLTTIMHEMGHAIGLPDSYDEKDRDSLMYGFLTKGERRLPSKGQAIGAIPGSVTGTHFLNLPVNIGTLNPGTTVTMKFDATISAGFTGGNITNTANISGSNFVTVNTNTTTVPVHVPPAVSTNPTNQATDVTRNATFTAAATGFPVPTVQWFVHTSADGVGVFNPVAGGTNPTLTITNATAPMNGNIYHAVFTNTAGTAQTTDATLTVNPLPTVSPTTLPDSTVGVLYNQTITASNGTGSKTMVVSSYNAGGTGLTAPTASPDTLTFNSTPNAAGTVSFDLVATDTVGGSSPSQHYSFVINPAVTLSPTTLPDSTVGVAYTQVINGVGGTGTKTMTVSAYSDGGTGLLAPATSANTITFNSTPTAPGTVSFDASATDTVGATSGTQHYTFVINAGVTLSPLTLPNATTGLNYTQSVTASGGTGNKTMLVSAYTDGGTGLGSPSTSANTITFNSTPSAAGTVNFDLKATDTVGAVANQHYTITVVPPCFNPAVVKNTNDSGTDSLRDALGNVCVGGTITFKIPNSDPNYVAGTNTFTITLASQLDLTQNVTISGPNTDPTALNGIIKVSGNNTVRVLNVNSGVTATINSLTIANGNATGDYGGGINNAGSLTLRVCNVTGNKADYAGGILNDGGTLTIRGSTISDNHVFKASGGIYNKSGGTLTIADSTISGNTADQSAGPLDQNAGGILNEGGTLEMVNSTVSGNSCKGDGAGVYNYVGGTSTLTNVTITQNRADSDGLAPIGLGGGLYKPDGTVILKNTIVADNFTGASPGTTRDDIKGAVNADYCLIGDSTGATITGGNNQVGNAATPINPKLNVLGPYGGPTLTHQPQIDSPVLDAGTDWTTVSANVSDSALTIDVTDPSGFAPGLVLQVELEQMLVTARVTNTLTVTRGINATSVTTHASGTAVSSAFDQRGKPRKVDGPDTPDTTATVDIGAVEANYSINVVSGSTPQSATVGTQFAIPLAAKVSESGNPIGGVTVNWAAPATEPTGSFAGPATAVTDNTTGIATPPAFTASNTPGSYTVSATASGYAGSADYSLTNTAGSATQLVVTAPANVTAGSPFTVTVTAKDSLGNIDPNYTGKVHFTKTDSGAGSAVPPDYTFTLADAGTHTFPNGVIYVTSGSQTLTATDTVNNTITGSANTLVSAAGATHFSVLAPASATAAVGFNFSVTALDQFNNTATGYVGTVHFTSTDGAANLPSNYAFTGADAGAHSFNATLNTVGNQTITGTDTVTSSITGTSGSIPVSAGAATHFNVTAPASTTAGTAFNVTVTALDAANNIATGYTSTIHFTSTDSQAALPVNYTFLAGDNGSKTFSAMLKTSGNQTITATDTVNAAINGTSSTINVIAGAATHYALTAPGAATPGSPFTFTVTALDQFNNTATSYTGTTHFTSSNAATVPADYTFVAGDNGSHIFSATLNNPGNQSITATDTVTNTITGTANISGGQAPAITSANNATFKVATAGTFTVTTTGFPTNASMVITETGALPGNLTFTNNNNGTATLAGTPNANTGGTYAITIKASNGIAPDATQSFTLTVLQGPAFTSADHTTFAEGTNGTFTVTTTGFPTGPSMSITRTGNLPAGVTFVNNDDGTATLSGTPALFSRGTYPFTIGANNGVTATVNQSFTLTVTGTVPLPTPTATATATATPTATATATATATPTATATATATPTATASATPTATPTVTPAQALNISTRLRVDTGDKVMIGGFIISGNVAKPVVLRGIGPSLVDAGIPAASVLNDPVLELHGSSGALITSNDNWKDSPQRAQIEGTIFQPTDDREAVIVATLPPAAYTVVLKGAGNTTGVGLVEVYDNNQAVDSALANISTRGFVRTGSEVMIGGFVLGGNNLPTRIAVRALGPSLTSAGLTSVMVDPTLELHNANGTIMISNDDWQSDATMSAQLTANGLGLPDPKESGIFTSLAPPGQFTAIVAGKNGGIGIALVEIYNLK